MELLIEVRYPRRVAGLLGLRPIEFVMCLIAGQATRNNMEAF